MKILVLSSVFAPRVGGMETVMQLLCREFAAVGHEVTLITETPAQEDLVFPFTVYRNPPRAKTRALAKAADIVLQANVSLKQLDSLVLAKAPVVVHHCWYERIDGRKNIKDLFKLLVTFGVSNICVSRAVARHIPAPSIVIPNPYDSSVFYVDPQIKRERDLLYVGRLVSDKGVACLLGALARLKVQGVTPTLSIVGDGPEKPALSAQVLRDGLGNQVDFVGTKRAADLRREMCCHSIMVVPSLWREPFGIVALEGLACGCKVIASEQGGLIEASGGSAHSFKNGDITTLASAIREAITKKTENAVTAPQLREHLERHSPKNVAARYLREFERIIAA